MHLRYPAQGLRELNRLLQVVRGDAGKWRVKNHMHNSRILDLSTLYIKVTAVTYHTNVWSAKYAI